MIPEGPSHKQLLSSPYLVILHFHEGYRKLQLNSAIFETEIASTFFFFFLLSTYLRHGEDKNHSTRKHRNWNPAEILLLTPAYCHNLRSKTCRANGVL